MSTRSDLPTKPDVSRGPVEEFELKTTGGNSRGAIILIPQPSDEPNDPLNWSLKKKYSTLLLLCFAAFAGAAAPTCHQIAYVAIAPTYGKTPIQLSYSISAAVAGLLAGPIFLAPFASLIGRSSTIFWSLLGAIATQVWAAWMTGPNDYISFVVSRLFAGLFGSVATILGSGFIMDVFFLHQRGKAFACYELSLLLGVIASPTIGGFIVDTKPWPVVFWWSIAPLGLASLLVFGFLQETGFRRSSGGPSFPRLPTSYLANRVSTFLPGTRVVPQIDFNNFLRSGAMPLIVGIAPVTILSGLYTLVTFAWSILISTELAIFLQTPIIEGGYGFTPFRNAAFTFTIWAALFAAQLTGTFYNDNIPLWVSRRQGHGVWHPEYRLWSMFLPAFLSPIGLGIFGAGLEYHLHYMVLALGAFMVNFSALLCVPVCINYVVECFIGYAVEVSVAMSVYRLALGLSLAFYFEPWESKIGAGWLFGMAAFFSLLMLVLMLTLAWKGHVLRRFGLLRFNTTTEEGRRVEVR